ncbi:hypothetical protein ACO0LG_17745 [Undibacterium sp. Ji42W]|uniref:hypothetical protein n=1 Tax=Undibacterium sp. Ji42W TaxID=3413039 RepID=UPI003BF31C50
MALVKIQNVGQFGVNKDLSQHEIPVNAWTDVRNIRFLDGYAYQFYGHGEVYNSPTVVPQYVLPLTISGNRYWLYMSAAKSHAVTYSGGVVTHTDITHAAPRTGVVNQWTHALLSGLPILNVGDVSKVPMSWDLNVANKFVDLPNWPANTYCKSLRAYKNFLVAMNLTVAGTNKPFLVKWSHPADPGAFPASWDAADATKDAGEVDLAEANSPVVDGLPLRDSFIIYTENSTHRMDFVGAQSMFRFSKILGMSGMLNRNCAVEFDGWHFVVTGSDVIVHDGQTASSVLDKQTRRFFFQNIDVNSRSNVFVFKNPFLNEIYLAYPAIGSAVCDKAMVYNFVDKTVSFRDLPNVNHANYGAVSNDLGGTWAQDSDSWDSDLTFWSGPDYTPDTARVVMASNDQRLYMLDASASFNGSLPSAYLERRGLSFDTPESIKLVKGVRPRIVGNAGETVKVSVGYADTPYDEPVWVTGTYTIGSTVAVDLFASGRYISHRYASGSAFQWRLDSVDMDVDIMGAW